MPHSAGTVRIAPPTFLEPDLQQNIGKGLVGIQSLTGFSIMIGLSANHRVVNSSQIAETTLWQASQA